ncbi:MAG: HAD hydrolase-like protein, partial [Elusimicrobiota bacterium]
CPHAPEEKCACRKPSPGLLLEAVKDSPADMPRSFMAGDKKCDLLLAKNAGLKGFLVLTGHGKAAAGEVHAYKNLFALARALPDLSGNKP